MAVEVWKFNLEGYLIRDPNNMDDPNNIDLWTVISEVMRNPFETSVFKLDATEDNKYQIGNTIYQAILHEGVKDG